MDTTYCDKCGLLHDPADGDCLGCELIAENKKMREALEFYDQAHRQNWAIDLNKLKTTAWDCLKELKEGE